MVGADSEDAKDSKNGVKFYSSDYHYYEGTPDEMASIVLNYRKNKKIEVLGVGDRLETSCAFRNIWEPFFFKRSVEEGAKFGVFEFLTKDITRAEWVLIFSELEKNSLQSSFDIRVESLKCFLFNNKSLFPILYENMNIIPRWHPDVLLRLIVRAYDLKLIYKTNLGLVSFFRNDNLKIGISGMITTTEAASDSRLFTYKPGAEKVVADFLIEVRRMNQFGGSAWIVTFGGDAHANSRPLALPAIAKLANRLLSGTTFFNTCNYLNLTLLNGNVRTIEANRLSFVSKGTDGTEYGLKGYEFYLNNFQTLPVDKARLFIIEAEDERRIIFLYNDGGYYPDSPKPTSP